ncbi:MAG: SH3 domain-containing protein [Chloroflexi bacterium]|nr:SH3 domain-containing protein [Chloroflexota bacterium]
MTQRTARGARATAAILLAAMLLTPTAEARGIDAATLERAAPSNTQQTIAQQTMARQSQAVPADPEDLTPNQLFAGRTLTRDEALAACGPAAAVAFARAKGLPVTLDSAVAAARKIGWTADFGMTGPAGQLALLERLGISSTLEAGLDRARVVRELRAGRPVIIRTSGPPGHYLVAERYDAASGRFDLGQSALVLRASGGKRWFTLDEIPNLGTGRPTHTLYMRDAAPARLVAATASAMTPLAATATASSATASSVTVPSVTAPSVPAASPSVSSGRVWVVDAGGSGARLRAAPSLEAKVVRLMWEGSRLTDLGETTTVSGRLWRRVIDANGVAAWIDASLTRPVP